jgi:hypothetical protein
METTAGERLDDADMTRLLCSFDEPSAPGVHAGGMKKATAGCVPAVARIDLEFARVSGR